MCQVYYMIENGVNGVKSSVCTFLKVANDVYIYQMYWLVYI